MELYRNITTKATELRVCTWKFKNVIRQSVL